MFCIEDHGAQIVEDPRTGYRSRVYQRKYMHEGEEIWLEVGVDVEALSRKSLNVLFEEECIRYLQKLKHREPKPITASEIEKRIEEHAGRAEARLWAIMGPVLDEIIDRVAAKFKEELKL